MINGVPFNEFVTYNVPPHAYFNGVLDLDNGDDGTLTEPVTLTEAKAWCRISVTDDDSLITALITTARQMCEQYTGIYFIQRAITVVLNNPLGGVFLPFGPVSLPVTSIKDENGTAISSSEYQISGTIFPQLVLPKLERITVQYDAGYTTLPQQFKNGILAQIAFLYENRGEEELRSRTGTVVELGLSSVAKTILKPLRRV